jgi:hypothetical protein
MAFLWRRTNTSGVWCSMGVSLLLTLFIPLFASWSPAMRNNPALHQEIEPAAITRTYAAREWDVKERNEQIATWKQLAEAGKAEGECPVALGVGERFEQEYVPPSKAIFWTKGIKLDDEGNVYGAGLFRPELFLMYKLGLDLPSYSVAVVESISLFFKLVFPFAALILFGLFGKQNDADVLDNFYCRLLTPVNSDQEQDAKDVAASVADPRSLDSRKLWPKSNWYIRRWDWNDWKGIIYAAAAGAVIAVLVLVLVSLGKG